MFNSQGPLQNNMQKHLVAVFAFLLLLIFHQQSPAATTDPPNDSLAVRDSIADTLCIRAEPQLQPTPEETFRKKKLITAILAFPVPFGFTGMHRIYLGCEPWIPVAYLCTGGGGLGLLPLMDFIFIVTANEEEFKQYENNSKMFMFVE